MIEPDTLALPTIDDVRRAVERIAPYARRTPVLAARVDGRPLTHKLEQLQITGSFKLRGALNALLAGPAAGHVVTASGGNHGIGVATAAGLLGRGATIYVPGTVPADKERRIAATGATVVRHGMVYAEAERAARAYAADAGLPYLPAYDDPDVVAGQGTVALEVAEQAPDCDAVVVAVGGGGLVAGTCLAAGAGAAGASAAGSGAAGSGAAGSGAAGSGAGGAGSGAGGAGAAGAGAAGSGAGGAGSGAGGAGAAGAGGAVGGRTVVAVEPAGCACLHAAIAAGEPVDAAVDSVAASALGATRIGRVPFAVLRAAPPRLALVSDAELLAARDRLWDEFRLAVEPAGAAPFAAWLAGRVPGAHPCLVVCGANAPWTPG
jgi:threonine dehydratase